MFDCTIRDQRCHKLVLHKIHKTGSGTLLSILYLIGLFNNLLINPEESIEIVDGSYDLFLSHFPGGWRPQTESWEHVKRFYRDRLGPHYQMVIPIREPLQRFISHCKYFKGRQLRKNRDKTLASMLAKIQNYMLQYMGIFNASDYHKFLQSPDFYRQLYIPAEQFDEGLALLARSCSIEPYCLAYMKAHTRRSRLRTSVNVSLSGRRRQPASLKGRRLLAGVFDFEPSVEAQLKTIGTADTLEHYAAVLGRSPPNETAIEQAAVRHDLTPVFVQLFRMKNRFDYDFYNRAFLVFRTQLQEAQKDATFSQDVDCLRQVSGCLDDVCTTPGSRQSEGPSGALCAFFSKGDSVRLRQINANGVWEGSEVQQLLQSFNNTLRSCTVKAPACQARM